MSDEIDLCRQLFQYFKIQFTADLVDNLRASWELAASAAAATTYSVMNRLFYL